MFLFHVGWCTDMKSSNFKDISAVYGEDALNRMNGCEFHFNKSVQRQVKTLDEPFSTTFLTYAKSILLSTTAEAYEAHHQEMKLFLESQMETKDQITWLAWWHERRTLMFKAFTSIDQPASNLSEVIHAGWSNSGENHLSLLNCAYADIKRSLLLSRHLEDLLSGV